MSGQIYKPVFGVTAKEKLTVTSAESDAVDRTAKALDILTQSAQSIGDFTHAVLLITIVVAHPVWVAYLITFVFSN
jgi:hypothetical protein